VSVNLGLNIPRATLPKALDIPQMYFRPPTAEIPSYKPMIVAPADLERPEEVEAEETTEQPEPPSLKIPVLDIKMPIPETAVVVTAVTTAVIAVTTTTVTQSLFEPIKKNVQKQLQAKVNKWKEKRKKESSTKSKME
jgi:hypothetical protein